LPPIEELNDKDGEEGVEEEAEYDAEEDEANEDD
jgi:hypothetical protein